MLPVLSYAYSSKYLTLRHHFYYYFTYFVFSQFTELAANLQSLSLTLRGTRRARRRHRLATCSWAVMTPHHGPAERPVSSLKFVSKNDDKTRYISTASASLYRVRY